MITYNIYLSTFSFSTDVGFKFENILYSEYLINDSYSFHDCKKKIRRNSKIDKLRKLLIILFWNRRKKESRGELHLILIWKEKESRGELHLLRNLLSIQYICV